MTIRTALLAFTASVAVLFCPPKAYAQPSPETGSTGKYGEPVRIPIFLSANCFELRADHFHGGVDIKTQGVTGKSVYSVARGYVSRVSVSPGGYGKAIYITHTDGTTAVYGHVESFYDSLDRYVYEQQYAKKSFALNLTFAPGRFPVAAGQLIALSGNRGSSGGPHLHYELRDGAGRPLNLLAQRSLVVRDTIAPQPLTLYYIRVDSVQGVPLHRITERIPLRNEGRGRYAPATGAAVEVAPRGYFAVEAKEFKNGSSNVLGLYRIEQRLDGEPIFRMQIDRVPFDLTRYVNALMLYSERAKRNNIYRLYILPNNPLAIYPGGRSEAGLVRLGDSLTHSMEIALEDESGNRSLVSFGVVMNDRFDTLPPGAVGMPVPWWKDFSWEAEGMRVEIPARALYESILFNPVRREGAAPSYSYSPLYDVHTVEEPLQKPVTLALEASALPAELRKKALLGVVSPEGRRSAAGGAWKPGGEQGRVEARVRRFGTYYIAVDTLPPRIVAEFKAGADLSAQRSLSLKISDDFAGIDGYTATIDGQWALLEYDPKSNRITHPFDDVRWPRGATRRLVVSVTDTKGNKRSLTTTYKR